MIKSSWKLDKGEKENNVTGTVKLVTPFKVSIDISIVLTVFFLSYGFCSVQLFTPFTYRQRLRFS